MFTSNPLTTARPTPDLLEPIATTGLHWFVFGLNLSAELNSVASSLPPTAYKYELYTAQPRCFRRVPIGATGVHLFIRASYLSTKIKHFQRRNLKYGMQLNHKFYRNKMCDIIKPKYHS